MPRLTNWKGTKEASKLIGVSPNHLKRLREDGTLKKGKHWRDIRGYYSRRATYQWHIVNISNLLEVEPEKR